MSVNTPARQILITGGTGSVGRALIKAFRENGDCVTFQYTSSVLAAEELCKCYDAKSIRIDFTKKNDLGKVDFDVVVNNIGINISDVLSHEVSLEVWNETLLINITIPFLISQQCLPLMIQKKWGRIINISSIYGLRGVEHNLPYTVSKHGLSGLTKTFAKEYAQYNITCNEICPGPIESEMMKRISERVSSAEGILPNDYLQQICDEIPIGRMAYPNEVAELAVFLASEKASYINGVSIPIDGGLIA